MDLKLSERDGLQKHNKNKFQTCETLHLIFEIRIQPIANL